MVTGGAGGIGSAVARAFAAADARGVAVSDIDGEGAEVVAESIRKAGGQAIAVQADIGTEAGNAALIDATEDAYGPIDLFHANAGVGAGFGPEAPDADWDLVWRVNVMAHVWAARILLPGWMARGEGYFVSTASMAGILTSLGSGPYATTKHAAVGFAEWMAITYHADGIKVSCLCPGGVNTRMLRAATGDAVRSSARIGGGEVREPEDVAETVVDAIRDERFLIMSHPEMHEYVERQAKDRDRWINGMRRLWSRTREV